MQESKDARPEDGAKGEVRPSADQSKPASAPTAAKDPQSEQVRRMRRVELPKDAPDKRTPEEWAAVFGHVDPEPPTGQRPGEATIPRNRPTPGDFQRWVFLATAAKAGWGTKVALDEPMTRAEYEEAVGAALDLPVGEHHRDLKAEEAERAEAARKEKAR